MKKIKIFFITVVILAVYGINAYASHIPVVLYHDIQEQYPAEDDAVVVTPQTFEEHISALLSNGYTPVSFEDICNASKGAFVMPEKPIVITFDDGYLTNYNYAFPILQKYGTKATIFVITSTVGRMDIKNPHFTWEQAKIMQQSGLVSIQSHTFSHQYLDTADEFSLAREIRLSKYLIEKNLGTKCDVLAFPYGKYNQQVTDAVKSAGYKMTAQVSEYGSNSTEQAETTPFVRVTVYGSWTSDELLWKIEELGK